MQITSLDLDNFRNYERLHLDFEPGITLIYGENAQGKTNLLEAISMLSGSGSHRGSKDREMIRFGCEESHLKMMVLKDEAELRIDMHLKNGRNKGIAVNRVPIRRNADFLGMVHTVFFSPEDLQIVKMGPAGRRKFIDTELCLLDKVYLNDYIQYRKVLEQRNKLLKDVSYEPSLRDTLEMWDVQLVRYGRDIIERRKEFIRELYEITLPVHGKLSGGREKLELFYEPDVQAEDFEEELKRSLEKDLRTKTTNTGPHRDDMSFMVTDEIQTDARIYGSQGQQRTCALSLKLAQITLVKNKTGDLPVLLLDDVLSELDSGRQKYLLDSIDGIQTFITCTGLDEFVDRNLSISHAFKVEKGKIADN